MAGIPMRSSCRTAVRQGTSLGVIRIAPWSFACRTAVRQEKPQGAMSSAPLSEGFYAI